MVADALSRKNKVVMKTIEKDGKRELIELKKINVKVEIELKGSLLD
jgi:hypothetical protein